jgi:hypothetical protein
LAMLLQATGNRTEKQAHSTHKATDLKATFQHIVACKLQKNRIDLNVVGCALLIPGQRSRHTVFKNNIDLKVTCC